MEPLSSVRLGSDGSASVQPSSLSQLLTLAPSEIERCDIARANLLCADGLPGAERLDITACLATLDLWTKMVGRYVRDSQHFYQRDPDSYHRHRGEFSFLCMVTLLKQPRGLGIGYQSTAIGNYDFRDSRDDLLHGLLTRRLGTCASLPVLFVAIGRRLGWPMHLSVAKRHVFCQWVNSDGSHRNLEGSCPGGGDSLPDEHYHRWPGALTRDDLASGRYLRLLTNAESLALFLETRGHCLVDNRRFSEARDAYSAAHRVAPNWSQYENHIYSLEIRASQARQGRAARLGSPVSPVPTMNAPIPNRGVFPTIVYIPGLPR